MHYYDVLAVFDLLFYFRVFTTRAQSALRFLYFFQILALDLVFGETKASLRGYKTWKQKKSSQKKSAPRAHLENGRSRQVKSNSGCFLAVRD